LKPGFDGDLEKLTSPSLVDEEQKVLLRLHRDGERSGAEFPIDEGGIDILAIDKQGRFVAFELKLASGYNKDLGSFSTTWVG
jgi:hypothetical protein